MNEVGRYVKKPIVVEGVQWPCDLAVLEEWGCEVSSSRLEGEIMVWNSLDRAWKEIPAGHWILKGPNPGDFYPCAPEAFDETYRDFDPEDEDPPLAWDADSPRVEAVVKYHDADPGEDGTASPAIREEDILLIEGKTFYQLNWVFPETTLVKNLWVTLWDIDQNCLLWVSFNDQPVMEGDHAAMTLDKLLVAGIIKATA